MQLNGVENQKHLLRSCWPPKTMCWFADLCISITLTEEMGGMLGEEEMVRWVGCGEQEKGAKSARPGSFCQILIMHSQRTGEGKGGRGGGGVTCGQQLSGVPRPEALTSRLTEQNLDSVH